MIITVAATILALFPLASHGGPLWQPLCYAQIGGLAVATFITLLLVPVFYSIAVLDLKIVKWTKPSQEGEMAALPFEGNEPSKNRSSRCGRPSTRKRISPNTMAS